MDLFNSEKIRELKNEIEYLKYELKQFKESSKIAYTVYKQHGLLSSPFYGLPRSYRCDDYTSQEMFDLILKHLNLKLEKSPEIPARAELKTVDDKAE